MLAFRASEWLCTTFLPLLPFFLSSSLPLQSEDAAAVGGTSSVEGEVAASGGDEEEMSDDDVTRREKEERKKRAKALANERRAKIMAQMASMQRAFIAGWFSLSLLRTRSISASATSRTKR